MEKQKAYIVIKKCGCRSVWCPDCVKQYTKKLKKMMSDIYYKNVRHIVLTLDPDLYKSDIETVRSTSKEVAYFIKNLKRIKDVKVNRYIKIVEWHKNGLPHYHLLVDVEGGTKIGHNVISQYWRCGTVVWESYFKTELQYKRFLGYFEKTGYMEKAKGHQTRLPAWALNSNCIIRRFHYSRGFIETKKNEINIYDNGIKRSTNERKTNLYRISKCGFQSKIEVYDKGKKSFYQYAVVDIHFKHWRKVFNDELDYKPGIGLTLYIDRERFCDFLNIYDPYANLYLDDRIEKGHLDLDLIYRQHNRFTNF